jgi:hypothetical protein
MGVKVPVGARDGDGETETEGVGGGSNGEVNGHGDEYGAEYCHGWIWCYREEDWRTEAAAGTVGWFLSNVLESFNFI